MIPHLSHVMTLANSIIGVSVLAMPFCFKQCGIVLATLVLLTSSVLSRLACHFLIKSAVMSRRRNFEFLAFHAFGTTGKFLVELFIIGFLLGTCIAFFVVVGDLGPQIVGKILNKSPEDIRTSVLVMTGLFIVLPLGLLRNIDSLSSVCTATIGFYLCLVLKVICESTRHIFLGDWYDSVMYWRPAGILQCLPIFSMALFCQTQLFEIYEAIPNVCLEKMNQVVRGALNICTGVYLCVGFFGYVAFCTQPFTGNILMSFEPSLTSDVIKMGFVFSVAFSFPLVIFPCRASLNSLLFRRAHTHEPTNNYIPEVRFRCLTLTIVTMALGTGILIPNIEFLLGIVGSTIGVMICLIFPAAFFIAISTKNTNERLIAQAILFFGMWIMVLGTYANIYAMEESSNARLLITTGKPLLDQMNDIPFKNMFKEEFPLYKQVKEKPEHPDKQILNENSETLEVRQEPPIPVERSVFTEKPLVETQNVNVNVPDISFRPLIEQTLTKDTNVVPNDAKERIVAEVNGAIGNKSNDINDMKENPVLPPVVSLLDGPKEDQRKKSGKDIEQQINENLIDSDAIKKEESELAAAAGDQAVDVEAAARHEKLRQTLEKHKIEQLEMMQEQKKLLEVIKEQKQEFEKMEKKRLANEQNKIERLVDRGTNDEKERKLVPERSVIEDVHVLTNDRIISNVENGLFNNATSNRDKAVAVISSKIDVESHGPILNALTNWTSKKNAVKEASVIVNQVSATARVEATADKTENNRRADSLEKSVGIANLPIALQMSNQSNKFPIVESNLSPIIKETTKENILIRRDILGRNEDHEKRDKREVNDDDLSIEDQEQKIVVGNNNITTSERLETDASGHCTRRETKDKSDNFISRNETIKRTENSETINIPTTTESTVAKTTGDVVDQRLADKSTSLDLRNINQVNSSNLKNRDLKALKQEQ